MKYSINTHGYINQIGAFEGGTEITDEPFDLSNYHLYRYDHTTQTWLYLPNITPINKQINNVEYDWGAELVHITIADEFRNEPITFRCTRLWSDKECETAIQLHFEGVEFNDDMIQISLEEKYIRKDSPYYSQQLKDWSIELLELGYARWKRDNLLHSTLGYLLIPQFEILMGLDGGEIKNWFPLIKIAEGNISDFVPAGVSGDGKTWAEWAGTNLGSAVDGYYTFKAEHGNMGLLGSELWVIHQLAYAEIINE